MTLHLTSYMATYRFMRAFTANPNPDVLAFFRGHLDTALAIAERHFERLLFAAGAQATIADISMCAYPSYPAEETGYDLHASQRPMRAGLPPRQAKRRPHVGGALARCGPAHGCYAQARQQRRAAVTHEGFAPRHLGRCGHNRWTRRSCRRWFEPATELDQRLRQQDRELAAARARVIEAEAKASAMQARLHQIERRD